jgi:hypothetical protein
VLRQQESDFITKRSSPLGLEISHGRRKEHWSDAVKRYCATVIREGILGRRLYCVRCECQMMQQHQKEWMPLRKPRRTMEEFIGEDFLLSTVAAPRLYDDFAIRWVQRLEDRWA